MNTLVVANTDFESITIIQVTIDSGGYLTQELILLEHWLTEDKSFQIKKDKDTELEELLLLDNGGAKTNRESIGTEAQDKI